MCYFRSCHAIVDFNVIGTWIVRVKGKHTDHGPINFT